MGIVCISLFCSPACNEVLSNFYSQALSNFYNQKLSLTSVAKFFVAKFCDWEVEGHQLWAEGWVYPKTHLTLATIIVLLQLYTRGSHDSL